MLDRGQARDEPAVDLLLLPPGVDRLLADAQIARKVDDLAAAGEQVEYATAELARNSAKARSKVMAVKSSRPVFPWLPPIGTAA